MQCYADLIPPSGITHSIHLAFISASASNLVVARTSVLQIFSLKQINQDQDTKLVLESEHSLPGTVTALGKVSTLKSKSGGDALLISFRDAKLSLIEWDPAQHSISTISIHYYENHDLLLCPWVPDLSDCISHLTIDPSSRCAAFNFGINNLAIIPFHQANDGLAMDDIDEFEDDQLQLSRTRTINGNVDGHSTPYSPSFVLPLTALDPGLLHPVHMSFLHEYRDPTIGVLYSTQAQSMNMAPERKDVMIYAVYTLDIEQRASTTLLSIPKLPNDLCKVVAVPPPVGGALLVGSNDIVHIDQGGRANAIGVNEFAKDCSAFPMADQSDLRLRLEGCQVERLGSSTNDLVIATKTGELVILSFRLDGRSVSGLSLQSIDPSWTADIIKSAVSTMASIDSGKLFIGSETADSVLIATGKKPSQPKRQTSRAFLDDTNGQIELDDDNDLDEDDNDDDDLYADSAANGVFQQGAGIDGSYIKLLDRLLCIGPIKDITIGRRHVKTKSDDEGSESQPISADDKLDLVLACGKGSAGSLAFVSRSTQPNIIKRYENSNISGVWALSSAPHEEGTSARPFDDMLVISERSEDKPTRTDLLSISAGSTEKIEASDFERGDYTVAAGQLASGTHVVVYPTSVRAYDKDFGLAQIFEIVDDEADANANAVSASIVDRYILLLKDDFSITLLRTDKSGDIDEFSLPASVPSTEISSASLYEDVADYFGTRRFYRDKDGSTPTLMVLYGKDGTLTILSLPNLSIQVFQYTGLHFLPTQLSPDLPIPKHWRNKDELAEVLLASLGDDVDQTPHLVVRNTLSDLIVYQPYTVPSVEGAFRFQKVLSQNAEGYEEDEFTEEPFYAPKLVPLSDVGGFATVFAVGRTPSMIVKTSSSTPKIHALETGPMKHVSGFHDSSCNRGFVYIDNQDNLCFGELPSDAILGLSNWHIRRIEMNEEISAVTYYPRTQSYVLATDQTVPFHLPREDEWHPEWEINNEKATDNFLPTTKQSTLKLLSSTSHSVISQYHFEADERILALKCLNLEVSEQTHERKDMIVVGTAITKGENVVTRGMLYIFDIVDVVPHPNIPETDLKLKLITKEDVRGAVTAICDVGSQGFVLASQGQKCMVRGLREDNAILPVAFLDVQYYVNIAKELKGTGMTILGDAFSGLWLVGYSEEPYKMQILGRDLENPPVIAAEFLPQEKQLYILSSDGNGELRVMHYDPENPETERGSVLLKRSSFNTGSYPTTMTLVPRTPTPTEIYNASNDNDGMDLDDQIANMQHQVLVTTQEGGLSLIAPLPEQAYRRLSTLQNILLTQLEHPCGLNPRAYRAVETDGLGGRGMIDGNLVKRWLYQSSQHKGSTADKVGGTVWEVRGDLEAILGAGLGYL